MSNRTYDPLSASVFRFGFPGGEEFFLENLGFMRERYGDEITDTLRAAFTEDDLAKAEEFASLLVSDFSYTTIRNDTDGVEIAYSAGSDVSGNLKLNPARDIDEGGDRLVHAVIKAAEAVLSGRRARARADAELAGEEASGPKH